MNKIDTFRKYVIIHIVFAIVMTISLLVGLILFPLVILGVYIIRKKVIDFEKVEEDRKRIKEKIDKTREGIKKTFLKLLISSMIILTIIIVALSVGAIGGGIGLYFLIKKLLT